MKKKEYNSLSTELIRVEATGSILTGSLTSVPIQIASVTVEDYKAGFDEGPEHNDFKEISFD